VLAYKYGIIEKHRGGTEKGLAANEIAERERERGGR
jgi:hypothetical protein